MTETNQERKGISLDVDAESLKQFDKICKAQYTSRARMIQRLIDYLVMHPDMFNTTETPIDQSLKHVEDYIKVLELKRQTEMEYLQRQLAEVKAKQETVTPNENISIEKMVQIIETTKRTCKTIEDLKSALPYELDSINAALTQLQNDKKLILDKRGKIKWLMN